MEKISSVSPSTPVSAGNDRSNESIILRNDGMAGIIRRSLNTLTKRNALTKGVAKNAKLPATIKKSNNSTH